MPSGTSRDGNDGSTAQAQAGEACSSDERVGE
jgi:hypothetical protein